MSFLYSCSNSPMHEEQKHMPDNSRTVQQMDGEKAKQACIRCETTAQQLQDARNEISRLTQSLIAASNNSSAIDQQRRMEEQDKQMRITANQLVDAHNALSVSQQNFEELSSTCAIYLEQNQANANAFSFADEKIKENEKLMQIKQELEQKLADSEQCVARLQQDKAGLEQKLSQLDIITNQLIKAEEELKVARANTISAASRIRDQQDQESAPIRLELSSMKDKDADIVGANFAQMQQALTLSMEQQFRSLAAAHMEQMEKLRDSKSDDRIDKILRSTQENTAMLMDNLPLLITDFRLPPIPSQFVLQANIRENFTQTQIVSDGHNPCTQVFKAVWVGRGEGCKDLDIVVKLYHNSKSIESFATELSIAIKLIHIRAKNVVRLLGACCGPQYFLVYEYVPMESLDRALQQGLILTNKQKLHLVLQIANGLNEVHSKTHVAHGELNPSNVLISKNQQLGLYDAQLCDFGSCIEPNTRNSPNVYYRRNTNQDEVNRAFIAPQLLANPFQKPDTKSDVYSFGSLMKLILGPCSDTLSFDSQIRIIMNSCQELNCIDSVITKLENVQKMMHQYGWE